MNIYKVEASDFWYDDYDSIVVVAESEEHAIEIASNEENLPGYNAYFRKGQYPLSAERIDLTEEGIVHASFNAG